MVQIFGLMNLIIDRLGDSVKPFAEGLLRLLPGVWQDAEGQSLLRIQVTPAQPPHASIPASRAPFPLDSPSHVSVSGPLLPQPPLLSPASLAYTLVTPASPSQPFRPSISLLPL